MQEVDLTSVYSRCNDTDATTLLQRRHPPVQAQGKDSVSYSASKGGVLSVSREPGVGFARQGIRVDALCPGPANTPLLSELFAGDAEKA